MNIQKYGYILFLLVLVSFSCNQPRTGKVEEIEELNLTLSYNVPTDLPLHATQRDLAVFAWNEFFALNWRAKWPSDTIKNPNSPIRERGLPDTTWVLTSDTLSPDVAVWETYIHRTELRPANGRRYENNLNTGSPLYSFINKVDTSTNHVQMSKYWVNLDEDNEIGSCYLFAFDSLQVMYMAKSNLVEYNYVRNNFPDDALLFKAGKKGADTTLLKEISIIGAIPDIVYLPSGNENGEGAIEIKTAWRKLKANENPATFLTRQAVYYVYESGVPVAYVDTFALIGMHIIHKTENYPDFVFASWEHIGVTMDTMQTIGLDTPIVNGKYAPNVDPPMPESAHRRSIPDTIQQVNTMAQNLIISTNKQSVWQYYQLIGVQGTPVDYKNRDTDPNYFMANYVIESDSLLAHFHGSFAAPFDSSLKNVVYGGMTYNMGGCQGCHGQAQLSGTDFSFLLDFGAGKPVPQPDGYLTIQEAENEAHDPDTKSANQIRQLIEAYKLRP